MISPFSMTLNTITLSLSTWFFGGFHLNMYFSYESRMKWKDQVTIPSTCWSKFRISSTIQGCSLLFSSQTSSLCFYSSTCAQCWVCWVIIWFGYHWAGALLTVCTYFQKLDSWWFIQPKLKVDSFVSAFAQSLTTAGGSTGFQVSFLIVSLATLGFSVYFLGALSATWDAFTSLLFSQLTTIAGFDAASVFTVLKSSPWVAHKVIERMITTMQTFI